MCDALERRRVRAPEMPAECEMDEDCLKTPAGIPLHEFFGDEEPQRRRVRKSARRF